jgi:single-stranded-DNA-specific exonuclease
VDVVVTDHHSLPAQLPEALALVNSQFLPHGHPLGTLPGVGVAYKLVEALCQRRGEPDACAQYLDLVALGIVADVALQTGETRYLLQRGLSALRQTPRLGLQTLFEMAELNPVGLSEEHIGFVIGPRLNALGRLSDANPIIEFLTTRDASRARVLAVQLEGLNEQRKLLTDQVYQGALAQLQKEPKLLDAEALILAHPGWPGGVVGIVASRLVDRFHKPTILLTLSPDGSARGSARSIEGCDITACLTENQALLAGFGGHPMAAGLSLSATAIPELRRALSRSIQRALGDTGIISTLPIDGYVSLADVSLELVHHIERIAPFGPGNPALVLATRNLVAKHTRPVGRGGDHHLVTVEDESGNNQRVIWWNSRAEDVPDGHFDLAYTVRATTYKGQADVQVEWIDSRRLEALPTEIIAAPPAIEIVDYRLVASPQATLLELQREGELQIWSEAEDPPVGTERHRLELAASAALVIWTIPPGPDVLRNVLEVVQPRQVYLFGIQPATSQLEPFLTRLAGLAKYAINQQQGETHFSILAARTAQRERVVVLGLQWLEASGMLKVIRQEHDLVWLASSGGGKTARLPEIAQALKSALDETSAYRMYFLKADKTSLFAY